MEAEEASFLGQVNDGGNKKKYQRAYSHKQGNLMNKLDSFYTEFNASMKTLPAEVQGAPPIGFSLGSRLLAV